MVRTSAMDSIRTGLAKVTDSYIISAYIKFPALHVPRFPWSKKSIWHTWRVVQTIEDAQTEPDKAGLAFNLKTDSPSEADKVLSHIQTLGGGIRESHRIADRTYGEGQSRPKLHTLLKGVTPFVQPDSTVEPKSTEIVRGIRR